MDFWVLSLTLVAAGGAIGAMARLAVTNHMTRWLGTHFPWGTLVVNLSGALLAGMIAARLMTTAEVEMTSAWLGLLVGLLGGYTTVSSFSLQTLTLWQGGHAWQAIGNIMVTNLVGLALAALGWSLAGGTL